MQRYVEYYPRRQHRSDWFLAINPRGELPVLRDAGTIVDDAHAVLVHLAQNHDPSGRWYPANDAGAHAQISRWLSFADSLRESAGAARLHDGLLQHHIDIDAARRDAREQLAVLDEHLWFGEQEGLAWLCAPGHPTVADIACFPDVMLAEEGGIALHAYPAIRRWTDRLKQLPGFVVMPGIFGR
jgi:glutathione S-transferase